MFTKLKHISISSKKFISLVVLILVIFSAISFYINKKPDIVKVEVLAGSASIKSASSFIKMKENMVYPYNPGNALVIEPDSSLLIYFPSGKTLALSEEMELEMISGENSNGEQIFLFENKRNKEAFSFNDSTGIHRVTAAVLGSQNNVNSRVLGISEEVSK